MGDIAKEISELLDEGVSDESGTNESSEASASGEDRREAETTGSTEETTKNSSEEVGEKGDTSKDDGSSGEESETQEVSDSSGEDDSSEEGLSKDDQIAKLQAEINRLSQSEQTGEEKSSESENADSEEEKFDPTLGYEVDDIVENKETFSKWANGFFEKAREKAKNDILRDLPNTINEQVQQQIDIRETARSFYENNSDLEGHKSYVARLAKDVAKEHEDWSFQDVLTETAKRARDKLGIKQEGAKDKDSSESSNENSSESRSKSPAFASGTSKSSSKKKNKSEGNQLSEVEQEINELIN